MRLLNQINNKKLLIAIFLLLISSLIFLQIHNLSLYPINRGVDPDGHIEYINYLKENKRVPLANEGWELYQTPLYYFLNSLLPNINMVRYLNFLLLLFFMFFSFIFFNKLFKNSSLSIIGVFIISSLPVIIYLTPTISNELFSAIMISLVIIYYVLNKNKLLLKNKIILGTLLGIALLSKATAVIVLMAILIDQLFFSGQNLKKTVFNMMIPLAIVLLIAGWYYIRNILTFGNPFIASIDFSQYAIHQFPGYRDIKFFTDLSGFLTMDLFRAHHYSLWAGTFFSWFYDGHNVIIPVQPYSKAGIALVLFSLPIFILSIIGYIKELKNSSQNKNTFLLLYPVLLFAGYVLYNFKLPFYSTVKGVFLVSSAIPLVYFLLKAIISMKKYNLMITLYGIFYAILIIKNFWILDFWYIK